MSVAPKRRHHPRAVPAIRHYDIRQKLGFNPYLYCWCGASLEMDYSYDSGGTDGMDARRQAFCNQHDTCEPQIMEVQS